MVLNIAGISQRTQTGVSKIGKYKATLSVKAKFLSVTLCIRILKFLLSIISLTSLVLSFRLFLNYS